MISVLTPVIPEREALLQECVASVEAQTYPEVEQLVGMDEERRGCSWTINRLAERAKGEWLLPLADDDLLLPGGLAALHARSEGADVVFAPPLVWGNADQHFFGDPPYIPSTALIRTSLWRDLGGYDEGVVREEDRGLWVKAMEAGAVFVRTNEQPVWLYRFRQAPGGGYLNKSYNNGYAR